MMNLGYARSASEFYRYGGSPYAPFLNRQGKLGPVVEVDSPEADAEVQEAYPWEKPTVVRTYRGESLGDVGSEESVLLISLAIAAVGVGIAYLANGHQRSPIGTLAMGAAGSVIGTAVVLLVRDIVKGK